MVGLFCFNGPVYRDDKGKYYANLLSPEFLDKYLAVLDRLVIVTRIKSADQIDVMNTHCITDFRISFIECPDLTSPKQVIMNKGKVKKILKEHIKQVDIVFVRVSGSIAIQAAKMAKRLNVPCLVEVVTCAKDVYWNHSLKGKLSMPFMYVQMRNTVKKADYVQYITDVFMQQRYPTDGKQYVCSNALIEALSTEELCARKSRYNEIKNREIKLVTVATVSVDYKGQGDVIKAIPYLIDEGYRIKYYIIGGGNYSRYESLAKNLNIEQYIEFCGSKKHSEILNILDEMDIYIQPSWAEAQGRSLVEAISRAMPCLCARVGGMPELIQKECVFKPKCPTDIADKLVCLLDSNIASVCETNYRRSLDFEKNKLIKKRFEIFSEIIAETKERIK